jgi:hypothetical protein
MPKLCKPTKEAINNRLLAYHRHARIYNYSSFETPWVVIYGLENTKKTGLLDEDDLLEELKIANAKRTADTKQT